MLLSYFSKFVSYLAGDLFGDDVGDQRQGDESDANPITYPKQEQSGGEQGEE